MMKYIQGRRKVKTRGCKNKSLGHFELVVGSNCKAECEYGSPEDRETREITSETYLIAA